MVNKKLAIGGIKSKKDGHTTEKGKKTKKTNDL
jgi:hypothetical protein